MDSTIATPARQDDSEQGCIESQKAVGPIWLDSDPPEAPNGPAMQTDAIARRMVVLPPHHG